MRKMMDGFGVSQAIFVAARLKIAEQLANGPRDIDTLARLVDAEPMALYRLLRALSSMGVFVETASREFAMTPLAACLHSDVPGSVRSWAVAMSELSWKPWGELLHCIRTGESAFSQVYGQGRYAFLEAHPEQAAQFVLLCRLFRQRSLKPSQ